MNLPCVPPPARAVAIAVLALVVGRTVAQTAATGLRTRTPQATSTTSAATRVDPFLFEYLLQVGLDELVPVYVVMTDRLGEDHWFPRVQRLPLAERRSTVVRELREHAFHAQREVLELLDEARRAGKASHVHANWLGNFVAVHADRATIERLASLASVARIALDTAPARERIEDGAAATTAAVSDLPAETPAAPPPPRVPGDAVLFTNAFALWNAGIDGTGVVVANVDGGMTTHGDLDARRWTNPGEIAGNGLDDDQNGFVDDVHGFGFDTGTPAIDDGGTHGTMTSGLLVGDGSCSGIARGQAPGARILTCRVLGEVSHWNAIQYAVAMGADVQTSSYSYKADFVPPPDYRMHRDVAFASLAAGLVRCNSSGNEAASAHDTTSPLRLPCNIAAPACVPAPWRDPAQPDGGLGGVIAVGAYRVPSAQLDPVSARGPFGWSFADVQTNLPAYAPTAWDHAHHDDYPFTNGTAPGLLKPDVLGPTQTTTLTAGPCRTVVFGGTSAATPAVAGVLVLWKSANPSLTPEDCAMLAMTTARDLGFVPGKENDYGSGLVDAERGLLRALCVHRVDHSPAFAQRHDVNSGPVHLAIDGAPSALAAILVGPQLQPLSLGFLDLLIGPSFEVAFAGVTDGNGDLAFSAATGPWLRGLSCATEAVLYDAATTGRLLPGNAIALEFF